VAVPRASFTDGQLFFVAYTGYGTTSRLLFDTTANEELTESADPSKFQARKTHIMLDGMRRTAIIERVRGGLSGSQVEALIDQICADDEQFAGTEISLNAAPARSFVAEMESFTRIHSATLSVTRPNIGWTDFNNAVSSVATDSDATRIDFSAQAKRGGGLNRTNGILEIIRQFAGAQLSNLKDVVISGARSNGDPLTVLHLKEHVESPSLPIEINGEGRYLESDMKTKMQSYVESRPTEGPPGSANV
jgi:hypothetical protein